MRLCSTSGLQGVSHVEERSIRCAGRDAPPADRTCASRACFDAGGHAEDPRTVVSTERLGARGRLFEDHVRVRPTDTERAHAGSAWMSVLAAIAQLRVDVERRLLDLQVGVRRLEVEARRDLTVFKASTIFMKLATPAAVSRWPMLLLTDPSAQSPTRSVVARNACVSACDLDRITDPRAGAVRLDAVDRHRRRRRQWPAPRRPTSAWPSTLGAR